MQNKTWAWLISLSLSVAVFSTGLHAQETGCDKKLGGSLSFADFQTASDSATYVDSEPGIKICLAPGTMIFNSSTSQIGTIKLRKDELKIVGDKLRPAIIHNQRKSSQDLWGNTAVTVEKNVLELANVIIKSDGEYGIGLFLNGARIEKLYNVRVTTVGKAASGIRVETQYYPFAGVPAGVGSMTDVTIVASGQYSSGISTVRQAKFGDILRLKITLGATGNTAAMLMGAEIRSLKDFNFSGGSGRSLIISGDSSIGMLERGIIKATIDGAVIGVEASSVALINKVTITNLKSTATGYLFTALFSQIGDIRNLTFAPKAPITKVLLFSGSQVSLLQNNLVNGTKAEFDQTNSLIEEQY